MKTNATKFAIGTLVVALMGGVVSLAATPADAGGSDKKTKTTTTSTSSGSSTKSSGSGGSTKGVSGMDLGSGR